MSGYRFLDRIDSPAKLKELSIDELKLLADEIRRYIIDVVSKNGGHLASSLGVVELTLALHYIFDSPDDAIIWDVGHQSYAHKMITGRVDRFHTLRKLGGLSGFPKRSESVHDHFGTGHASTSISAALGILEAKRALAKPGKVVAVIGDGGMTGGLAFEGMNNAGNSDKDLIVILNENSMSISRNVGAISTWFSRKFSSKHYNLWRKRIKKVLKNIPHLGDDIYSILSKVIESSKVLLTPGILFEGFGFKYTGPIDGHDIEELISVLRDIKSYTEGPQLVHVVTQKGKGYPPAEEEPRKFHGVGPFDIASGKPIGPKKLTYSKVFGDTLIEIANKNSSVVAITGAMTDGTGLTEFSRIHDDRFFDVGIAEEHAVLFAAGLATQGLRPYVAIYSTFLQRAYDQIIHDVCLQNLPVVFVIDRAGIVGEDGATHSGSFDMSYLRLIPNITIFVPADENELRSMLHSALSIDGPVAIRFPRGAVRGVEPQEIEKINPATSKLMYGDETSEVLMIAAGNPVWDAVEAAKELSDYISCAVLNIRCLKPLDTERVLRLAEKATHIFTIEENTKIGGLFGATSELLAESGLNRRIIPIALPDSFIEHGSQKELRKIYGLDRDGIKKTILGQVKQLVAIDGNKKN